MKTIPIKNISYFSLILAFVLTSLLVGCGSSSSTTASTDTSSPNSETAAAAAGGLFGNNNSSAALTAIPRSSLQAYLNAAESEEQEIEDDSPGETCSSLDSDQNDPEGVTTSPYNDPGTYGASETAVTVEETDFCELPDGTANEGDDLFAGFELTGNVEGDCVLEDGTEVLVTMAEGSYGIWRNTDEYEPEIYGRFNYEFEDGSTLEVDCTIFLGDDGQVVSADCADDNGLVIETDNEATCSFDDEE